MTGCAGSQTGWFFRRASLPQIHVENALFGTPAPTVRFQSYLWHGAHHLHWWDYATWFIYLTHFFATLVVAAVLWTWAHDRFARYATMVCALALAGFATYVLYPAVPPWLAAQHGNLGEANRTIAVVWKEVPLAHFGCAVRERPALREQRRGDAVAARRVRAADHPCISGGSCRGGRACRLRSIRRRWHSRSSIRVSTTSSTAS